MSFYLIAGVAALGGLLFGYDTGVISGALLFIREAMSLSATMQGIVVAIVLAGAVIGSAAAGSLSDRFGRRRVILVAGLLFIAGALFSAAAEGLTLLLCGRFLVGLGIGIASMLTPRRDLAGARARSDCIAEPALYHHRDPGLLSGRFCARLLYGRMAPDAGARSATRRHSDDRHDYSAGEPALARRSRPAPGCRLGPAAVARRGRRFRETQRAAHRHRASGSPARRLDRAVFTADAAAAGHRHRACDGPADHRNQHGKERRSEWPRPQRRTDY